MQRPSYSPSIGSGEAEAKLDWRLGIGEAVNNELHFQMCPQLMHSTHFSPSSLHLSASSELVVAASFI